MFRGPADVDELLKELHASEQPPQDAFLGQGRRLQAAAAAPSSSDDVSEAMVRMEERLARLNVEQAAAPRPGNGQYPSTSPSRRRQSSAVRYEPGLGKWAGSRRCLGFREQQKSHNTLAWRNPTTSLACSPASEGELPILCVQQRRARGS